MNEAANQVGKSCQKRAESYDIGTNMLALYYMHYNFVRRHQTLRVSPATEAGITDRLWTIDDITSSVPVPVAKKRGPYKKRT